MKDEKLFLEWVEHIDIDRDSIPENSVSNIKKQIHKTLENEKGNSKPKPIYRSKVAIILLVVIGTLATVGIVDAAIKYIKGTVLYNKDLDSIINDTSPIDPLILSYDDQIDLEEKPIPIDPNDCVSPDSLETLTVYEVTELSADLDKELFRFPSFVFDSGNMTVITNENHGWKLNPGDIVHLNFSIDPTTGNYDSTGEALEIGYILDKQYVSIDVYDSIEFDIDIPITKEGHYKFSIYNWAINYIKVNTGSIIIEGLD